MKKILIITNYNLDGAVSAIALKYVLGNQYNISILPTTITKFRENLLDWLKSDKLSNYDLAFICGIDTSNSKELIDFKNVYIIDHHEGHNTTVYNNCKTHIVNTKSTTELIYGLFLKNKQISNAINTLIQLTIEYNTFDIKHRQARDLNIIFWSLPNNKVLTFVNDFEKGFNGWTKFQTYTIDAYYQNLKRTIEHLQLFKGSVEYKQNKYKILSAFADGFVDDLSQYLTKKYTNFDILFLVNINSETVYIRKNKQCDINLGDFAKHIANGGGYSEAASCKLNEQMLELSKQFIKYAD